MGRFGMGHGALAIRDRRRRHSRLSVTGVGYQPQQHCENYMVFAQRSQRKNSVTSSQSVPVKGGPASADVAAVGDVAVSIPGQLLTSSDFPKTLSLPEVTDGPVPGPSWWPGPPFQQGGIVRSNTVGIVPGLLPQQAADDQLTRGKLGLLSDIFNGNRWNYFQERLMPRLKGAVMPFHPDTPLHQDTSAITSHHLTFDQELPNGKSAWGGRGGGQKKVSEAQKRWVSKNKVSEQGECEQ
ncbi:uncharacterized protein, partial [Cherax quadricarinatus]|uniref:uncharacterized protein n=1 Tax=Cherax quadricarinatus TaxID=27406 RepID=UPI00387E2439